MPQKDFDTVRKTYQTFCYNGYSITKEKDGVRLSFDFSIDGLCSFHPETVVYTDNLQVLNVPDAPAAKAIVFCLGMVELISYWKAACPPRVLIKCGHLSEQDIAWWKKLYFGGLSEFFYRNGIAADENTFMEIVCTEEKPEEQPFAFQSAGLNLIPVGGGKDSCVTTELLRRFHDKNRFFTVNDQPARTETVLAGGYTENEIVRTHRTIDPMLLGLNRQGFFNGHTPFSAIVAFLSYYCAYLIGAENIVLSNESSANESNISGTEVNHQYSKSFAFEQDFADYCVRNLIPDIHYFSLLRPFSELQIAKQFAAFGQYHESFRSCNRGSKQNIWCAKCAKCLFVFSILSPFMPYDKLCRLFGSDMLNDSELLADFDGLVGFSPVKPFECVGTVDEIVFALQCTAQQFIKAGRPLPVLLAHFVEHAGATPQGDLLKAYNDENHVPSAFLPAVKEMYAYVSADC